MLHFLALLVLFKLSYQNCHQCSSCDNESLSVHPHCFCDSDCEIFGDCCGSLYPPNFCPPSSLEPLQHGSVLECHPTQWNGSDFVTRRNNSFLMVSSCPTCYEQDNELVNLCTSRDILWPPVTDTRMGIFYLTQVFLLIMKLQQF